MRRALAGLAALLPLVSLGVAGTTSAPGSDSLSRPAVMREADLPSAYKAGAFLLLVARTQLDDADGRRRLERLLAALDLEPGSTLARELVDLAVRLESRHPYVLPDDEYEVFGADFAAARAWAEARERDRFEALGDGFGRWLLSCETSGLDVEDLLERLLARPDLSVTIFSAHKSAGELRREAEIKAGLFERALRRHLGRIPAQLAAVSTRPLNPP